MKSKDTENKWKEKAKDRSVEAIKLRKRLKETAQSRDNWKKKYMAVKEHHDHNSCGRDVQSLSDGNKPDRYNYSSILITLCIRILSYSGSSLRASRHFILQLYLVFELEGKSCPSHTTIRMWACKFGYYQTYDGEAQQGDWVLIVDESVSLGENRVLLVLGLRLDNWNFDRAASGKDIELLYFGVSPKWESTDISPILKEVSCERSVKYITSDRGNNLLKSYKEAGLIHIPDCTHALAKALEHYCKKCEEASKLLSQCGLLRQKWNMGKKTVCMPPSQRKKARFHNLKPISDWAVKMLDTNKGLSDDMKEDLDFLQEMRPWIEEFCWINELIGTININLKKLGFHELLHKKLLQDIKRHRKIFSKRSTYAENFLVEVEEYLQELKAKLPNEQCLFCCSDIIESTFGRMKYRTSPNSPFGMTEFALAIVNLGKDFCNEQIIKAMENTKDKDILEWKRENLPPSLFEKRKAFFKQNLGEVFP